MAERLVTFEGKTHAFPDDFTDAEISSALGAIPSANAAQAPKAKTWSDVGGLALAGAKSAAAPVTRLLEELATNPGVRKGMATVGQLAGGIEGGLKAGPLGIPGGAWAGGKAGWHGANLVQRLAAPVAEMAGKAAPYVQAAGTLSGAQGALDLAQMAEPTRKDIGFLGVGTGTPDPSHPALLNLLAAKVGDAVKYLVDQGMSQGEALRTVLNMKARGR